MLALVCYLPPTPAKVQPIIHKALTYILSNALQMLMQHYTSYAGIGILAPPHPTQSAVLLVHISHSIPANVSIYSGLYKTALSSSLP